MKYALVAIILFSSLSIADTGFDVLIKDAKTGKISPIVKQEKQLVLDDPFLVQLYGSWMAARIQDKNFNDWVKLVLEKENEKALLGISNLKTNTADKLKLVAATKLYLMWQLKLNQSFVNLWLDLSGQKNFLNTPFGVAMDQVIGTHASQWLLDSGINLLPSQKVSLAHIKNHRSVFNDSMQALFNLRGGVSNLELIGKLPMNDPLRLKLADSAILAFAKQNELAKAAKLLKEIYEPELLNEKDIEKISAYYMLLARLLYQAKAFEAAEHYYSLIPQQSKKFLDASVEKLWISMRNSNLAKLKGDLHTLTMKAFAEQFQPEVEVISAMANLRLCQFEDVKKSFDRFIKKSSIYAKEITNNIKKSEPLALDGNDFYLNRQNSIINNSTAELALLNTYKMNNEVEALKTVNESAKLNRTKEIKRRWKNREQFLLSSIRKMRFVKVEFLSTMRRLSSVLYSHSEDDSVNLKSAGIDKTNKIVFPYDGVVFGDELFHYQSDLKNLCLKERQ